MAHILSLHNIDKKLDTWKSSLPPPWECREYPVRIPTDEVLRRAIFEYGDIWTSSIWSKWRCIRIYVHEMIIDCISRCGQSNLMLGPTSDAKRQLQVSSR